MEDNNPTPTSIILKTATTMSEMNDSTGTTTNNTPSTPDVTATMTTTTTCNTPSALIQDVEAAFKHIRAESSGPYTHTTQH